MKMINSKIARLPALFTTLAMILILFIGSSCEKQVPGPQGDPGTAGLSGNLIQKSTNAINVLGSTWTLSDKEWESWLVLTDLSEDVVKKGEVKVYKKVGSDWMPLPYGKGYLFTQYSFEAGIVRLKLSHIHGGVPDRPADEVYRVVIFSPAN